LINTLQSKSKGKENSSSYLTGKEPSRGNAQPLKSSNRNIPTASGKPTVRKETNKESVSPRKKFG